MLYVLGFGGCRAGVLSVFSNLYSFFRAQEIPLEMTHQENRVPNEQNKWLATNSWQSSGTEETSILGRLTYLVVHRLRAGASGMPKPCSCKLRISEVLDLSFTSSLRWREACFQAQFCSAGMNAEERVKCQKKDSAPEATTVPGLSLHIPFHTSVGAGKGRKYIWPATECANSYLNSMEKLQREVVSGCC